MQIDGTNKANVDRRKARLTVLIYRGSQEPRQSVSGMEEKNNAKMQVNREEGVRVGVKTLQPDKQI